MSRVSLRRSFVTRYATIVSLTLGGSIAICLVAIAPLKVGLALVAVMAWAMLPGVIIARRLYGAQRGTSGASLLVGPVWGFATTSLVLLALWTIGVRSAAVLALAPLGAVLLAIPASRLAGALDLPSFDRRDLLPVLLVLAVVPLVVGRPYARVGEMRPEGKAYRAYFTADFVWAMAVVAEVSKGDVPPRNPFMRRDRLHYYWLPDLLSAIEYRQAQHRASTEQILLTNALMLDLAFMAFFYFFVRHFVEKPAAAAIACTSAVLFSSFEGLQQLVALWWLNAPLHLVTNLNIDAVSRWIFGGMPIDGLQRLLLYQPHHATAWGLSLSALLVLLDARDPARPSVNLVAGGLLAIGLLLSSFLAVMIAAVIALCQLVSLLPGRRWNRLAVAGLMGAIPIAIAVWVSNALHYVDRSGGSLVAVGRLNPTAAHAVPTVIFLSFGPMLLGAAAGAYLAARRRAGSLAVAGAMMLVSAIFYFFVDVRDHQHVYVGWRAGHLLFMALAPLVGFALQDLWAKGPRARLLTTCIGALVALAALPTTAIDLYNTQDTSNRRMAPGFHWTVILTPDELEALKWIRQTTPTNALVQIEPSVRDPETWAYIPAFAERRMVAGLPISMIPLRKYQDASSEIRDIYRDDDSRTIWMEARALAIDYLVVAPAERDTYPRLESLLDAAPQWFRPVFRNRSVTIYSVLFPRAASRGHSLYSSAKSS
ncbi:MAG: hypothetical protein HYS05_03095 [Acidobacteria bacterium]|nr:hypothetical protein [Acidobacteriota bacterium]